MRIQQIHRSADSGTSFTWGKTTDKVHRNVQPRAKRCKEWVEKVKQRLVGRLSPAHTELEYIHALASWMMEGNQKQTRDSK